MFGFQSWRGLTNTPTCIVLASGSFEDESRSVPEICNFRPGILSKPYPSYEVF